MSLKDIKPVAVLTAVVTITCALLIVTSSFIPDNSGVLTEKLQKKCEALMGNGEYYIVESWIAEGYKISKPENIEKLIAPKNSAPNSDLLAFEITVKGYKPDGLTVIVAMNSDGSVRGISIVSVRDDPGIGTRVQNPKFLEQFNGVKITGGEVAITKKSAKNENEIDGITGATYSAKGVVEAVNIAVETYPLLFEESGVE